MGRRISGAIEWSVPMDTTRAERTRKPAATGWGSYCPPVWLLVELPTALLLAVFVGTGWLGYAGTGDPAPVPAEVVVAPADAPHGPR
ncbi:hypothetical protein ACWDSJ_21725 [Nocardia sp. NPDC003482]